jgi:hypothetical protein
MLALNGRLNLEITRGVTPLLTNQVAPKSGPAARPVG